MRIAWMLKTGLLATIAMLMVTAGGCQKSQKLTPEQGAIATEMSEQGDAAAVAAVAQSRYRTYRWLTPEEMASRRLGFDPTMSGGTRYEVEQAVDDNLADKGFRRGEPADFAVAFNTVYIDRNRSDPGFGLPGDVAIGAEGVAASQMQAWQDMELYRTPEEGFTILFFDAGDGRLLWRGSGREHFASMAGTQSAPAIEAAVYHALDAMPVPLAP